ncbi:MAG: xerC 3 [Planctomycetota bacterium]|nr:xerC 3 [Planctomycetota bacterium]
MASFRKRGRIWYYRYVDADGAQHECKGCPDRRETEAMAAGLELESSKVRAGVINPKDIKYRNHELRSLADHLADWRRDMAARGKTPKHADQFHDRAGKLAALVRGSRLADLEPGRKSAALERAAVALAATLSSARLSDLGPERIQAALARLRDAGKALQTINHYRAALRAFVRWAGDNGRLRDNPMRGVKGFNPEEDPRHERRSLSDDELSRLIAVAERGPERFGMSGTVRAVAYRLATVTGFRVAELRTLTPESFSLDGPEPSIFLHASATKNRRPAEQPIPLSLAPELSAWLRDKAAGENVLPLHHDTAKAIRADLADAGIPYATEDGVADFHSLRAYFVSALVRAGASIKEVQTLARHAKPQTTLAHYAKVSVRDLRGAVESLPSPGPVEPRPEALAATGTHGRIQIQRALPLPYGGDGSGRTESGDGGTTLALSTKIETPETPVLEGFGRVLSATDGSRTERGGFEPPNRLSPVNGLANRRFRPLSHLSWVGLSKEIRLGKGTKPPRSRQRHAFRCESIDGHPPRLDWRGPVAGRILFFL